MVLIISKLIIPDLSGMKKTVTLFLFTSLCFLSGITIAWCQNPSILLAPIEFESKMNEYKNAPLIDVRTPGEFEKGHIKNAINISWNAGRFDTGLETLNPAAPVFVYCLGGGRSSLAAIKLKEMGFQTIYELQGGLMNWRAASLPEIIGSGTPGLTMVQFEQWVDSHPAVMIVFNAQWCSQCNRLKPEILEIEKDLVEEIMIYRVDVDENRELVHELKIAAIPVIRIYKNSILVWEHTGYAEKSEILEHLQ